MSEYKYVLTFEEENHLEALIEPWPDDVHMPSILDYVNYLIGDHKRSEWDELTKLKHKRLELESKRSILEGIVTKIEVV